MVSMVEIDILTLGKSLSPKLGAMAVAQAVFKLTTSDRFANPISFRFANL
jgi:hypothetical protein